MPAFAYGDAVYRDFARILIEAHRPDEALQVLDRSRARTLEEGFGCTDKQSNTQGRDVVDARAVARKLAAPILFYSLGPEWSYLGAIYARETRLFELPKEGEIR